jgi:hypothetical protein
MSDKIALNPGSIFAEINARISSAKYSSESESPNFVRRSSIQDIMAKSAEELTFQFSELVEKSEKEQKQRDHYEKAAKLAKKRAADRERKQKLRNNEAFRDLEVRCYLCTRTQSVF